MIPTATPYLQYLKKYYNNQYDKKEGVCFRSAEKYNLADATLAQLEQPFIVFPCFGIINNDILTKGDVMVLMLYDGWMYKR